MTYTGYTRSRTTEELKEDLKQLVECIEVFDCFGTRDLILREYIEAELEQRGVLEDKV